MDIFTTITNLTIVKGKVALMFLNLSIYLQNYFVRVTTNIG